jgi:hypothetical protein
MNKQYHEQQLIQRHVPLLQNNYSLDVILKIKAEDTKWIKDSESSQEDAIITKTRVLGRIDFLMCQSCFWCASYISPLTEQAIVKCPSCTRGDIESLPIVQNESYRFHYDMKRGVTTEFFR